MCSASNTKPFHYIYFNSIFRILHNCPVKQIQHHPVKKVYKNYRAGNPAANIFTLNFTEFFLQCSLSLSLCKEEPKTR